MRIILIFTGCLYLIACSLSCKSGKNVTTAEPADLSSEHTSTTAVPVSRNIAVNSGINKFGIDLFRELSKSNDFVIFSPYSISSAMAMCYAGARENTAAEMSEIMHFDPEQESFHPAFRDLSKQLLAGNEKEGASLTIANALWAQDDFPFLDEYYEITGACYAASVQNLDFSRPDKLEESRLVINRWVEEQTRNKITELLKPDTLSTRTRLVLTNAIYFHGAWLYPFNTGNTSQGDFRTGKDQVVSAGFMKQQKPFLFYEDDNFQAVELPYKGKDLVMLVILPRELLGIQEAMTRLDYQAFASISSQMTQKTEVSLSLPKFTSGAEFILNDALKSMGIKDAFGQQADFSGMTGKKDLFISVVVHKTFIEVSEAGTEAAAATGIGMALKSAYVAEPKIFNADHPFFYAIYHKETGVLIFAGWLENPT